MSKHQEVKEEAKTVKIKLLRDCQIEGQVVKSGTVCEVDEKTAAEFCDKSFEGYLPIYGYSPQAVEFETAAAMDRKKIFRAQRVG